MIMWKKGTTARCNKCDRSFVLLDDKQGYELRDGEAATRLTDFATCPNCGRMDSHWNYRRDLEQITNA